MKWNRFLAGNIFLLVMLLFFGNAGMAQGHDTFQSASTNVPNSQYLRIDGDSQMQFRIKDPDGHSVEVQVGTAPKVAMVKGPDGVWTATTRPAVPGFHYY